MLIKHYNDYSAKALPIFLILLSEILLGLGSIVLPPYISLIGTVIVILFIVLCVRFHLGLYILIFAIPLEVAHFVFYIDGAPYGLLQTNSGFRVSIVFLIVVFMAWLVRVGSKIENEKKYILTSNNPISNPITMLLILLICCNAISFFWTLQSVSY